MIKSIFFKSPTASIVLLLAITLANPSSNARIVESPVYFKTVWDGSNPYKPMNIYVFSAQINGIDLGIGDEIGVFDGDKCVGAIILTEPISADNAQNIVCSADDGTGMGFKARNPIQYRFWDADIGLEYTSDASYIDCATTTPIEPQTFEMFGSACVNLQATGDVATQTIDLLMGWNWISLNVLNAAPLNLSLQSIEPCGDFIKGQESFADYYDDVGWYSSNGLDGLIPGVCYMIRMNCPATLRVTGIPVDYENSPLVLKDGWNWIGYLPQKANTVDDALATIRPNGDFMKNQTSFTEYYDGFGWYSSNGLEIMSPGIGYKLYMAAEDTLIYGTPPETIAKQCGLPITSPDVPWSVQSRDFEDAMAVTGVLKQGERECASDNLFVGAFVDGECRGVTGLVQFPFNGRYEFNLLVYGCVDEEIRFKAYDNASGAIGEADNTMRFEIDGIVGDGLNPYVVQLAEINDPVRQPATCRLEQNHPNPFNPFTTITYELSETSDVRVTVYDIRGQLVKTLMQGEQSSGVYNVIWDSRNERGQSVVSGIYFVKMTSGTNHLMRKMILTK